MATAQTTRHEEDKHTGMQGKKKQKKEKKEKKNEK